MSDDQFRAWLIRQGKPESRAMESHRYGDPANHVKFEREKKTKKVRGKGMR